jgi:DNA-binding MarR family transcriptional regulator
MNTEHHMNKVWEFLCETRTALDKVIKSVLKDEDLTEYQARIIMAVNSHKPLSIGSLAERISYSQGNVSSVCKKMEQKGFIVRQRNKEDERIVTLELTPRGEEKAIQIQETMRAIIENKNTPLDDFVSNFAVLNTLLDGINKLEGE